ncbi:MAG: radical SAM protein [Nitrospirae bacterium]|nr:radical SAM protein [Nitrospirota bacterium]
METAVHRTHSICPQCERVVPAVLAAEVSGMTVRSSCPDHGPRKALYWKDSALYHDLTKIAGRDAWCTTFECLKGEACDECLEKTYNIMIDVTQRCNLDCPVCFADANQISRPEPTIDEIRSRLPPAGRNFWERVRQPNVVLIGGEPTMRKDLPALIRTVIERGYIPRLSTNGLRLGDPAYVNTLWEAGLRWVVVQFDGFDRDAEQRFRGAAFLEAKLRAIRTLSERGFKIQLTIMMAKGVNTPQIGEILRFLGREPNVFWASLYPHTYQSRAKLPDEETHVSDMLDEIERYTGGRIRRGDFLVTMRVLAGLHRLLRIPNLQQKVSTLPMILVFKNGDYFPLSRMLNPLRALRHLDVLARLAWSAVRLLRFQELPTPSFIRFLSIEKFQANGALDLEEASNCHMAYMTPRSFVPFDLYNIVAKRREADGVPGPRSSRQAAA